MANPFPFWLLYAGLILIPIAHFGNYLGLILWLLLLMTAYFLRKKASKNEDAVRIAHASWAIRTYWLELLLPVAIFIVIMVIVARSDTSMVETQIESYLDEFKNGSIDYLELLKRFWAIELIRKVCYVILCGLVLILWPIKRAVQGMIALIKNREPASLSAGLRFAALILGILIIALLSFLGTYLGPKML